jgi:hypothetical protein
VDALLEKLVHVQLNPMLTAFTFGLLKENSITKGRWVLCDGQESWNDGMDIVVASGYASRGPGVLELSERAWYGL